MKLTNFVQNNLIIGGTTYPHKNPYKRTNFPLRQDRKPGRLQHHQEKQRRRLHNAMVKREPDSAQDDHHLVDVLKIKLKACKDRTGRLLHIIKMHSLKKDRAEFKLELRNKFCELSQLLKGTIDEMAVCTIPRIQHAKNFEEVNKQKEQQTTETWELRKNN